MNSKLKPCPRCKTSWFYVSKGDYCSGYEAFGCRVDCLCGFAWKAISWQKTEEEAVEAWNRRANDE